MAPEQTSPEYVPIINNENVYAYLFGWVSVICWIMVFTPQIWRNYKEKNGKGLSLCFLLIWLVGDVFNLLGVVMEHLLPTMFLLAVYYTLADVVLLLQVLYYRNMVNKDALTGEYQHLLNNNAERAQHSRDSVRLQSLICLYTIHKQQFYSWCGLLFLFVVFLITGVRYLRVPQFFGWFSAICYVCSRFPQILKNKREESTQGLSLLMFCLGMVGNLSYCVSILLQSTETHYILQNLPWLVGSGGTLILDVFIAFQFYLYKDRSSQLENVQSERYINTSNNVGYEEVEDENIVDMF
jgi:solute carrier family 66 (lysosomal lysine-arginine transporter), member 1